MLNSSIRRLFLASLAALPVCLATPAAWAQADEEEEYTREFSGGINFNTNAGLIGGGMLKWTRPYKENLSRYFQVEIVEVKHPKEFRYVNDRTQNVFVLGKSNYLFVIRPMVGMEKLLFRKAADQGVQVSVLAGAGVSIGIEKPYFIYYDYTLPGRPPQQDVRIEQYDPNIHSSVNNILGNAGFATNFGESKIKPGVNVRTGISFEYGEFFEKVAGMEVGVAYEQFFSKVILIPESENRSSYTSVYLTLYGGRRK